MSLPGPSLRAPSAEREFSENKIAEAGWTRIVVERVRGSEYDMMQFCSDSFGLGLCEPHWDYADKDDKSTWYVFIWYGTCNFYFKNERDAALFILRWS